MPASAFFSLSERLQHGITHRLRWRELRPVQELTIAAVGGGENVIVLAPTAGGKTEAAMFPVIDGLLLENIRPVGALYLSPLRALLNNQEPRVQELARLGGFEAFKWHGDVSATDKRKFIADPAHILMITPESLEVILMTERYDQRTLFGQLRYVIIDEIHGFAGDDRGDHLVALLERLAEFSSHDFQRIGLSATVGNPDQLVSWVQGRSRRPGRVVDPKGEPSRRVIEILPLSEDQEAARVAAVLARGKKSLLFADARSKVEKLQAGLERFGIRAFPHHGSLSRALREESEEAFRAGSNCCIVSTSTMELGLDVGDLDQVLQLGAPTTVSAFLQRLGRSGRRPGTTGHLSFLVDSQESFLVACALVSLALRRWIEPVEPSRASYAVFVHQTLARVLAQSGLTRRQAVHGLGTPYCFAEIDEPARTQIIDRLVETEVLLEVDGRLVMGPLGEKTFGYANFLQLYSVFDTPPFLTVKTRGNREIGTIDAWFVLTCPDGCFLLGGKPWEMVNVDWERNLVTVQPAGAGRVPTWSGTPRLYSRELCEEVLAILKGNDDAPYLGPRGLRTLHQARRDWADKLAASQRLIFFRQDAKTVVLYTFAGGKINNVMARLHEWRTGERVVVHNFFLKTNVPREGSYWAELEATLALLGQPELPEEALRGMVEGLRRSRLSKFQEFLPRELETRFLAERLFDVAGAQEICGGTPAVVAPPEAPPVPAPPQRRPRLEREAVLSSGLTSRTHERVAEPRALPELSDPFVAQLAELSTMRAATARWIFVPHASLKWTLGERLCQAGVKWVNMRFVTPFELALDMAAPELLACGIQPKPEGLGPTLVHRLLDELPGDVSQHFRPLIQQPRMAETLWESVKELRMAGLSSADLTAPGPRGEEFRALLSAYEQHLEKHKLGDRATLLQTAMAMTELSPIEEDDLVLELPSVAWPPLERRFLDALPGERVTARVPELDPPRRWALACPHRRRFPRPIHHDVHLLRHLGDFEDSPAARQDGSLHIFYAGRRDAEIQEVLRRVMSQQLPLDAVEIATHDPVTTALLWDKLAKHGLPATFEEGLLVSASGPGRAVLGILEWLEHRLSAYHLRGLLLGDSLEPCGVGLSAPDAAQLLEESEATWGRESYVRSLDILRVRYQRRAHRAREDSPELSRSIQQQAEKVARLGRWLEDVIDRFPPTDDEGRLDFGAFARALQGLMDQHIPIRSDFDRSSAGAISRVLRDLAGLEGRRWAEADCRRHLRDKLEGLRSFASRALPGHLHVTPLHLVGMAGRPTTFILALEEGSLVPGSAEDPVLTDAEREALHPALRRSSDRVVEATFAITERLATLSGEVTLSYSCRDFRSGEELLPSWLLFRAARLLWPDIESYDDLNAQLGEPVGLAPVEEAVAASDTEWWLARLSGQGPEAGSAVQQGFPWLCRGLLAEQARLSNRFTPHDGLVPSAAGRLDPRQTAEPVSASRLQSLAACPYQYFLAYGLEVSPRALTPVDPEQWLDAANRGEVLHEVFARYHRRLRQDGQRPGGVQDLELLRSLLEAELDLKRQQIPCPSETVETEQVRALQRDLDRFLRLEESHTDREPVACEVGFGLSDLHEEPLATPDPVWIDLGEGLRFPLRGRIDRIDRLLSGEGGYEVIDYKTGRALAARRNVRYDQGRLLQHALYALVAQQLLEALEPGARVSKSSYYFPVVDVKNHWLSFPYPDEKVLRQVLLDVLEPLQSGAFAHAPDLSDCQYCDFRAACSNHRKDAFLAKLDNPASLELECRRRLGQRP